MSLGAPGIFILPMAFKTGYALKSFHLKQPKLKEFSLSNKNFGASTFMPNLFRIDRPVKHPKPKTSF